MSAAAHNWVALLCASYILVKVLRGGLQHLYATRFTDAMNEQRTDRHHSARLSVDVIVPVFNEKPAVLDACLRSLVAQDYEGDLRVFVVDDGSNNQSEILPTLGQHEQRLNWWLKRVPHQGKRQAIDAALWQGDGDVVVTVDSDTVLSPDSISRIVTPFAEEHVVTPVAEKQVGAVSASFGVHNEKPNWLTQLIHQDYRLLVDRQRAAQSCFRAVLCCWGGFAAYRRTALKEVWDRHLAQKVAGRPCTSGDDLHLTLELLASDYDSVLQPNARALTNVPATPRTFARQQLRWSRSFVRELRFARKAVAGRHWFLTFEVIAQVLGPVLLAAAALSCVVQAFVFDWTSFGRSLAMVVGTVALTSASAAIRARDLRYLLYGAVYHTLVMPGWILALVTFRRDRWGSRKAT